jgi:hypothetical protein
MGEPAGHFLVLPRRPKSVVQAKSKPPDSNRRNKDMTQKMWHPVHCPKGQVFKVIGRC